MGKYTCMDCKASFDWENSLDGLPRCPRCHSIHVLQEKEDGVSGEHGEITWRAGEQHQAKSEEEVQEAVKRAWAEIARQRGGQGKGKTIHWVDNQLDAEILRLSELSTRHRNEIRAYSIFRSKHAPKIIKLMLVMALLPLGVMLAAWVFLILFTPP